MAGLGKGLMGSEKVSDSIEKSPYVIADAEMEDRERNSS